jgi:hypothetical protein
MLPAFTNIPMIRKIEINGKKYTYEEVRHIDEHVVHLPKVPKKAIQIPSSMEGVPNHTIPLTELIINLDVPKEEAHWNREVLPKYFYHYIPGHTELWAEETVYKGVLTHLSEEDTRELIYYFDRENYRRTNGVFMIQGEGDGDGVIEYLTEDNYFFLQWNKVYGIKDSNLPPWRKPGYIFGEFRKFQRDVFQIIWKVKNDPNILGLFIAKPKKTGITQILAAYYLNKSTLTQMAQMGIMSKGGDAANVNMLFFFHAFDGLPQIFKPTTRDRADVEGKIFFAEPAIKTINTRRGMERFVELQAANPLNSKVWAAPTKAAGFDSPVMSDIWLDEFPKYDTENKQDPDVIWKRNQETVKLQDVYNGKVWITSYPPEEDTDGFFQARKIYYDSKLAKVNPNTGRTPTGLITLYISALNAYQGCFDIFGNCDTEQARWRNKQERETVKNDPAQLQAKKRQYSETEEECWSIGGVGSLFNPIRISELSTKLDVEMRTTRFYEDGRYEWENSLWEVSTYDQRPNRVFCPVKWIPLSQEEVMEGEEGRVRQYERIPSAVQNSVLLNGYDEKGNLLPPEITLYAGAADPTDLAEAGEVSQGSKNASYTLNLPDILLNQRARRLASKIIITEYLWRPDNPWEWYEDLVKEIIFTGKTIIVEANKKWVATQLIKDGLGRFMLVRRKDNRIITRWTPELEKDPFTGQMNYTLLSTETEELNTIIRAISRYIQKPRESEKDRMPDYGSTIKSERLLDQLAKVTKKTTKFHDLFMAFGWSLIAIDVLLAPQEVRAWDEMYEDQVVQRIWDMVTN